MARIEETKEPAGAKGRVAPPGNRHDLKPLSPRRRVISLVIGDTIAFLVFAAFGQSSHGEATSILSIILIAAPFIIGWFLVAPLVGAFNSEVLTHPRAMTNRTILAWLLAWPVGMFLRWLFVDRARNTPPGAFFTFAVVVLLINLVILLVWRWPFALNNSLRERGI